jgi:multisubunit Na+/H+ antiporter MnhB subunit
MTSRPETVIVGTVARSSRLAKTGLSLLAFVTGGLAVASTGMEWLRVQGGIAFSPTASVEAANGLDLPTGLAAAATAVVLAATAVGWLLIAGRRRGPAVVIALSGTVILGSAIYTLVTRDDRFVEFAASAVASAALPAAGIRQVVTAILDSPTTDVHVGIGLLLAMAAGASALTIGLIGLAMLRAFRQPRARWAPFAEAGRTRGRTGTTTEHLEEIPTEVEEEGGEEEPSRLERQEIPASAGSFDASGSWSFSPRARRKG